MKRSIQRSILIVFAVFIFLFSETSAQFLQLRLVSSANAWQQQDTVGQSSNHMFGYQTVQLSLAGENLSFHTYLQGFNDFAGPLKNEGTIRFYNFYLKYTNLFEMLDLSLGRQAIFAGVGNGTIDGGVASVRLLDSRLRVLGYYGALPSPGQKFEMISDQKDNTMFGAQIIGVPMDFARVSLSYMQKNIKPETYWAIRKDSLFNPITTEISPSATAEQYMSGDLSIDYNIISAYARSDFDLNQENFSRVQLFTRVKVMEPFSLTGEYIHREPRLSYNSIFWVFAYSTISEYELGAEYAICKDWQVFGKFGSVSYGDDNSNRITLGGSMKYASASFSWNTGYGGELAALSVNAGYPLFDNTLTPTIMVGYAHYKLESNTPTTDALSGAIGAVYRPIPALSLDAQVQWIQNKIYNNDVRLFLRGSYYFSDHLNIF
ncbi:MAG: hypothetical protein ABR936_02080 [Bacteroidota bacterium]|jgi:hypothetical protein